MPDRPAEVKGSLNKWGQGHCRIFSSTLEDSAHTQVYIKAQEYQDFSVTTRPLPGQYTVDRTLTFPVLQSYPSPSTSASVSFLIFPSSALGHLCFFVYSVPVHICSILALIYPVCPHVYIVVDGAQNVLQFSSGSPRATSHVLRTPCHYTDSRKAQNISRCNGENLNSEKLDNPEEIQEQFHEKL